MPRDPLTPLSKFLAYVLRHRPDSIGLELDDQGWVNVDELLAKSRTSGKQLDRTTLERVVASDSKGRYAFSEEGAKIRASQGHSVDVELGYAPAEPPDWLFHGTPRKSLPSIQARGLDKGQRHHVHLSPDVATARTVGARRGPPVVLRIAAKDMAAAGHLFYRSASGVWLVERVPPEFLQGLHGDEDQP